MLRTALFAAACVSLMAQAPASGTFKLVSGTTLDKGIAEATEDLPLFERMYARHRLANVNPLYKSIKVAHADCGLELTFDDRKPQCQKEGTDITWTREDGEQFSVSLQIKGRRFIQTYKGKEGQRVNTFYISPGGQLLVMDVTVRSHKLGKSLRYQLVYERDK